MSFEVGNSIKLVWWRNLYSIYKNSELDQSTYTFLCLMMSHNQKWMLVVLGVIMIVDFETFEIEESFTILFKCITGSLPFKVHSLFNLWKKVFVTRLKTNNSNFMDWNGVEAYCPILLFFQVLYSFASNCALHTQNSEKSGILQHLTNCKCSDIMKIKIEEFSSGGTWVHP